MLLLPVVISHRCES